MKNDPLLHFLVLNEKFTLIPMLGREDCVLRLKIKTTKYDYEKATANIGIDESINVEFHYIPSTITDQDHHHGTINIDNDKLKPLLEGKLGCFSASDNHQAHQQGEIVELIGAKIVPTIAL